MAPLQKIATSRLTKVMAGSTVIKALTADLQATRDRLALLRAAIAERHVIIKAQGSTLVALEKRLKVIEAQPMPGGPVVRAVAGARLADPAGEDQVAMAFDVLSRAARTPEEKYRLAEQKAAHLAGRRET